MTINVEEFYTKYGPMVLRRCRRLLRDEALSLDAMQEVFVQVLLKEKELADSYPSSLLYTMATNISIDIIRKRKRRLEETISDDLVDRIAVMDDSFDRVEHRSVLDRIFNREKTSTRLIAILHFVDGLTLEEVAKEVNMSVSGVRKRLRFLQEQAKENSDE
jgi:RNA polymerase sigma-70 factor (ECF subfamily)